MSFEKKSLSMFMDYTYATLISSKSEKKVKYKAIHQQNPM